MKESFDSCVKNGSEMNDNWQVDEYRIILSKKEL